MTTALQLLNVLHNYAFMTGCVDFGNLFQPTIASKFKSEVTDLLSGKSISSSFCLREGRWKDPLNFDLKLVSV